METVTARLRVSNLRHLANLPSLRVSNFKHLANFASLPSVKVQALGKASSFVVCQVLGTRQTFVLCRVSNTRHSANTRQRSHFSPRMHRILPRVHFAECFNPGTRQKASLPSVTLGKAATNNQFIRFGHSHVPHSNKHHIHHR